jgi:hypothetical protein
MANEKQGSVSATLPVQGVAEHVMTLTVRHNRISMLFCVRALHNAMTGDPNAGESGGLNRVSGLAAASPDANA